MDAKFTPGPWEWRDIGSSTVLRGAHGLRPIVLDCVRAGMQGASFRVRCNDIMRKVTACSLKVHEDAKLIAAAPELYEALRLCLSELEERFDLQSSSTNPGIKVAANEARAALAKAV